MTKYRVVIDMQVELTDPIAARALMTELPREEGQDTVGPWPVESDLDAVKQAIMVLLAPNLSPQMARAGIRMIGSSIYAHQEQEDGSYPAVPLPELPFW